MQCYSSNWKEDYFQLWWLERGPGESEVWAAMNFVDKWNSFKMRCERAFLAERKE